MTGRGAPGMPAAVLLDQDGTVVDTEPIWLECETAVLHGLGGDWSPGMRDRMVGQIPLVSVRILIEAAGRTGQVDEGAVLEDLLGRVARRLRGSGIPWLDGVPEFLVRLHDHGIPVALVSSSYLEVVAPVVEAAPGGGFPVVVTGEAVAHPKPDPEPYLIAADRLGVDIRDCLVVEDSPTGLAAGVASGARVASIPAVVPVAASPRYSRFRSARELTDAVLVRLMSGEVVDALSPGD